MTLVPEKLNNRTYIQIEMDLMEQTTLFQSLREIWVMIQFLLQTLRIYISGFKNYGIN